MTAPENSGSSAESWDVLVAGSGNVALCAALAAADEGASVATLEAAPEDESRGNSRFAGGVMRFAYDGVSDIQKLCDLTDDETGNINWESKATDEFHDEQFRG